MRALGYSLALGWRSDLRNRDILLTYYGIPLLFFFLMGGIFTAIQPGMREHLGTILVLMALSIGSLLGTPIPLSETYYSDTRRSFQVGGIPLSLPLLQQGLSALLHLGLTCLIITLLAPLCFDAAQPHDLGRYLTGFLGLAVCSLGLGTVMGVTLRSRGKLTMVAQAVFMPSLLLSGTMFPIELLPRALQVVGQCLPMTWAHRYMTGGPVGYLVLLLAVGAILWTVAVLRVRRFRAV